jgi:predicted MFS family arabinose efflux permease
LALLVGGSATLWLGAGGTLLTVDEQPSEGEALDRPPSVVEAVALFREDAPFRTFVVARSLMMSTALVSPLIVSLSAQVSEAGASGVGPFVIATGVAALIASPIWGRLADQSSRLVMAVASASSGLIALGFIAGRAAGLDSTAWLGPATYLLLAIVHAGARMGRKTYVVDLGHGDRRTRYVAVSNSIIGVALLVAGGVVAVLSQIGPVWALSALATAGLGGGLASLRMREIHRSV